MSVAQAEETDMTRHAARMLAEMGGVGAGVRAPLSAQSFLGGSCTLAYTLAVLESELGHGIVSVKDAAEGSDASVLRGLRSVMDVHRYAGSALGTSLPKDMARVLACQSATVAVRKDGEGDGDDDGKGDTRLNLAQRPLLSQNAFCFLVAAAGLDRLSPDQDAQAVLQLTRVLALARMAQQLLELGLVFQVEAGDRAALGAALGQLPDRGAAAVAALGLALAENMPAAPRVSLEVALQRLGGPLGEVDRAVGAFCKGAILLLFVLGDPYIRSITVPPSDADSIALCGALGVRPSC
jgi:hypothetical protein